MKKSILAILIIVLTFTLVLSSCNSGSDINSCDLDDGVENIANQEPNGDNDVENQNPDAEQDNENQNSGVGAEGENDITDIGTNGKRVPIYQGMTITNEINVRRLMASALSSNGNDGNGDGKPGFDYDKDNGNHNGHFKGDHTDNDEEIDQGNPYPDNSEDENLEQEAKNSFEVLGPSDEIYYASQNQDIYINIHINNPDNFEIMSFTLNGKKYSNYMFEDGSDMQNIILKHNVGDQRGIVEYTIDAIKYVDGTEIKDVIVDGNKTVKAGIRVKNQVETEISDVIVDTNALSFNVNVTDSDSLIAFSNGVIKAVIYDGDKIVSAKELTLGKNSVSFEGLESNTLYQYAVVAYYDDFSGNGRTLNTLYKQAFYTEAVVLFCDISLTQDSISFGFAWHTEHTGKSIKAIKLYKDGKLISTLDGNATRVENLLSNNIYQLVAEFENQGKTESIVLDFITATKAVPTISVEKLTATQNFLEFNIVENDIDSVGEISKIELLHENGTIVADSTEVRSFENILSNNEYTVKVTYIYNLNDGEGDKEITAELKIATEAKTAPDFTVTNSGKSKEGLDFVIDINDVDNVGSITSVVLSHASGAKIVLTNEAKQSIKALLSDNTYTLSVTYTYDLCDGSGTHQIIKTVDAKTLAKAAAEFSISSVEKFKDSVRFGVYESDIDNVGEITKIELIHASGIKTADDISVREFTNLLSNNNYILKITYTYDLNDGKGAKTIIRESSFKTNAKAEPSVTFDATVSNASNISFGINEVDIDNVGEIIKLELLLGNDVVGATEDPSVRRFENLRSSTEYTVRLTYKYNLCDGSEDIVITKTTVVRTGENDIPYILISGATQTQTSIAFAIEESDDNGVGAITKIELYKGDTFIKTAASIDTREFKGLLSNTEYTVKVTYTYNLNDGTGDHVETRETTIKTFEMAKPSIIFDATSRTKNSVNFAFDIVDIYNVAKFERIELIKGEDVVSYTNNPEAKSFTNLLSNTVYTVKVIYSYDINDGNGVSYVEKSVDIKTYEQTVPEIVVINPTKTQESVGFEIFETDPDSVGAISKIELIHANGTIIAESTDVRVFENLFSNNAYKVKVTYIYDLCDGEGEHTIIKELEIATLEKSAPSVIVTNTNKTQSSFDFVIDIIDEDNVGKITKVELIHEKDGTIILENVAKQSIVNLLSDNTYVISVTYTYDLNDGFGQQEIVKTLSVKTVAKTVPNVIFDNVLSNNYDISFGINEVDIDNVGEIIKIELYLGDAIISVTEDQSIRAFSGLLSNNEYTVILTYKYNLCNGSGDVVSTISTVVKTKENVVPGILISGTSQTHTDVSFTVEETDPSDVGNIVKIELYKNGEFVKEAENVDVREFTSLLSNTEYTVKITYAYNLNDGNGEHVETKVSSIKTYAKAKPSVIFERTNCTTTAISFDFDIVDVDETGRVYRIELIKDGAVVAYYTNDEVKVFDSLASNKEYTLKVIYEYNLNDGTGNSYIEKTKTVRTLKNATPSISIINIKASNNPFTGLVDIEFEIAENDKNNIGSITQIELIHLGKTVETANAEARCFPNLLSNNDYTVKVTYSYDLNEGDGEIIITKSSYIRTPSKETPRISLNNPTKTKTSVGFNIEEIDNSGVGEITKIELVHANGTIEAKDLESRCFENLLSNNEYTVKVTYVYDLNDGYGEHVITKTVAVTTDPLVSPSFILKNEACTIEGIKAEHEPIDVDGILLDGYKMALYKGDSLICEIEDKIIDFTGLEWYTEYTIKFTFDCDLNDGNGKQTLTHDCTIKTKPFIDVLECNIANTSAVSEGETIYMAVKLNNPVNMEVESVVVNGQTYGVTDASTRNKIFVEIVYNDQFPGGDTYLKIDKVNAKIDDTSLMVEPHSELSDNVFINGKISVVSIDIVDENFEPIEDNSWVFPSQNVYVMVTYDNPTGYVIENAGTKLDDNHYYAPCKWSAGSWFVSQRVSSIEYHNEYIDKTIQITPMYVYKNVYKLVSDEIKYVSTPSDLKNIKGGYYYQMTNDIDLSGIEWRGSSMVGMFDGNGYSIKNMSFVGTVENETAYLGLFTSASGVIKDVKIEEATIIADIDSGYTGVLVSSVTGKLIIDGCEIDEYTIVDTTGYSGGFIGYSSVMQGYTLSIAIKNSTNNGSISGKSAGGLIGYGGGGSSLYSSTDIVIENSTNNGRISGTSAGGIIGYVNEIKIGIAIKNSTNNGSISGTSAGGIVGHIEGGNDGINILISECINNGTIKAEKAGAIVGDTYTDGSREGKLKIEYCTNNGNIHGHYTGATIGNVYNEPMGAYWLNISYIGNVNNGIVYKTLTFETNGGEPIEPLVITEPIALPVPKREGYVFLGWYSDPEFDGYSCVKEECYATATLYARWISEDVYFASLEADSFEGAYVITEEGEYELLYIDGNSTMHVAFTPCESKTYTFTLVSEYAINYMSGNLCVDWYNDWGYEYGYAITPDEYTESEYCLTISHYLEYGETYYIEFYASSYYPDAFPEVIKITVS